MSGALPIPESGRRRLLIAIALILCIWLGVLPYVATQPDMQAYLEWLEEERIDPSAMYYTDLERMDDFLKAAD